MKALSTIIALVFATCIINAQTNWLHKSGGANHDEALDMVQDVDNNIAVTGYFNSESNFGGVSLPSAGYSDVFLQKLDEDGNTLWAKRFGGTRPDRGTAMATDDDGNFYVTGFFMNEATFGSITLSTGTEFLHGFVIKTNPAGEVQWAKQFGSNNDDEYPYGIDVDDDGNIIVTGQFRGTGTFGSTTLTSAIDPDTDDPSMDIFTFKLDNDGDWLWAKQGSANDDDRGLDVTSDLDGNVYVTGQFSDTVVFDIEHPNTIDNSGFLLKYNAAGEEQWLIKFSASFTQCNNVQVDGAGNIVLSGDYSGQMAIFTGTNTYLPYEYPFNVFVFKVNDESEVLWTANDGSDNPVTCRAMDIADNDDIYIGGTFSCTFTEYSEAWGAGLFNSAGYKDVFVTQYRQDGVRDWERHFAGPKDDACPAITKGNDPDMPVIAGSFELFFNVPSSSNFTWNIQLFNGNGYQTPNWVYSYCDDVSHGAFHTVQSFGNKDIFISNAVDLDRLPYDFYTRDVINPDCTWPVVEPCAGYCGDSLAVCGPTWLSWTTNTGSQDYVGPGYSVEWQDGSTGDQQYVSSSGLYSIAVERDDGCTTFTDSVYVEVLPVPIASTWDDCTEMYNTYTIQVCDTVTLEGSVAGGFDGMQYGWAGYDDSTAVVVTANSGYYTFVVTNDVGCSDFATLEVEVNDPDIEINTFIYYGGDDVTFDSVMICDYEALALYTDNFTGTQNEIENLVIEWTVELDGVWYTEFNQYGDDTFFYPQQDGVYTFTGIPIIYCCNSEFILDTEVMWVYVEVEATPDIYPFITGEDIMCPGDSTLLTVNNIDGATSYYWSGPCMANVPNQESIMATCSGWHYVYYTVQYNNCVENENLYVFVQTMPDPLAWTEPEHGVVCPGDSVQLIAQPGLAYQWIGPLGEFLDITQTMYVNVPGFYYCIQTNYDGCVLESNTVEVSEYNSPYLIADVGTELCILGYVTIQVATNDYSNIEWAPPLTGNDPLQYVYDPGVYSVSVEFCDIVESLTINVTEEFVPSYIITADNILCGNDSLVLTANDNMESYTWMPGGETTQELLVTEPGTYWLLTTDDLGCVGNSGSFEIYGPDVLTPLPQDQEICYGDEVLIPSESPVPVYWSATSTFDNVISSSDVLQTGTILSDTTFWVIVQDNQCDNAAADVFISINLSSITPEIIGDTTVCVLDSLFLQSISDGQYNAWTLPDGDQIVSDNYLNSSPGLDDQGWYSLYSYDAQCTSAEDSIFIDVEEPQWFNIEPLSEVVLCEGDTLTLATNFPATTYNWITPQGIVEDDDTLSMQVFLPDEGSYTLELQGTVCPITYDFVFVDVIEYPAIDLNEESLYCLDGYLYASVTPGYDIYIWNTGDSTETAFPAGPGMLTVAVTTLPYCTTIDSVYVESIDCIEDFMNIMTPNGDGLNDIIDFKMLRIDIEEILIFNRWGNLVRHIPGSTAIWDGKNDGHELLSEGTYYYIVKTAEPRIHFRNIEGYVQLVMWEK